MPLDLHKDCKARLRAFLEEHLPSVKIDRKRYINFSSTPSLLPVDEILPKRGPLKQQLNNIFDEQPFFDFTIDMIGRILLLYESYDSDSLQQPINVHSQFVDISFTATNLVDIFSTLPWRYTHTFRLPKTLYAHLQIFDEFVFSPKIRIIRADEKFEVEHSLATDNKNLRDFVGVGSLLFPESPSWEKDAYYFQIQEDGYTSLYGGAKATTNAESMFRTFLGLGLSLKLFKHQRAYAMFHPKERVYVHIRQNSSWKLDTKIDLDDDLSEAMSYIAAEEFDGHVEERLLQTWMVSNLQKIKTCFASKRAERILLAGRWIFDSFVGKNELLSFIQAMVALEILLGDKDKSDLLGLGELLSNRCAYLIGKSKAQRDEILNDFAQIYNVRSQIVHRGKSRLSSAERRQFYQLQWMCTRVIQEEIDLLEKDGESSKPT
jgi:Apea-like HEPN